MNYRHKAAVASVYVFAFIAAAAAGGMFLLERPTVSESEKRELERFPQLTAESWFSGEFADGLDRWFTDTVPCREDIIGAASALEDAKGIPSPKFYGNVSIVDPDEDFMGGVDEDNYYEPADEGSYEESDDEEILLPEPVNIQTEAAAVTTDAAASETQPAVQTAPVSPEAAPAEQAAVNAPEEPAPQNEPTEPSPEQKPSGQEPEPAVPPAEVDVAGKEFINNGILVDGVKMYGKTAGVMLFGGNKKQGTRYAAIIEKYKKALGKDVNVYNIVVPTSAEFYLPKEYSKYCSSEKDAIDHIYASLPDDVMTADAYSALEAHKDEYIYFRTDHHWTDLGAYYAYTAFCDAAGIEAPELSYYEKKTKEGYVGSLYTFTKDKRLKNAPDTFDYYMPPDKKYYAEFFDPYTLRSRGRNKVYHEYASGVNMYGLFLGGDNMHIKITVENEKPTGRRVAVFKESYGNAFVPYLINGFDEIYVIDIRYFKKGAAQYLKDKKVTDVIFINNVFAANTSSLIGKIENIY